MNCQDISSILDDRDIASLGDAERAEIETHLHVCADCAGDWAAHQRLSAAVIPTMPVALARQCRVLVAAQPNFGADTGARRRTSRLILIGTLTAVAAAAALLSAVLRNDEKASTTTAATTVSQPPEAAAATSETPEVVDPSAPKAEPSLESPRFTVRVLPLQNGTADEPSKEAVKSFYAALLGGLRAVPGLTLVETDTASSNEIAPGEFLLRVTGDGTAQGRWNAKMLMYARLPVIGDPKGGYGTVPHSFLYSSVAAPLCTGSASDRPVTGCSDPQGGAAGQIELMRQVVFPPDPTVQRMLRTRLLDRTLDPEQRWKALQDLRTLRAAVRAGAQAARLSEERSAIDAETLRGALDLAASTENPRMRGQIWRLLRGVRQPELIQPLIDSARLDGSDSTRLEAVATLTEDYAPNAKAHAALESIALNDSRELVRMVAQRGISGDAVWNAYAVARLQDATLPDTQRLEALSYMIATAGRDQVPQLRNLLDDKAVEALAQVIPRMLAAPPRPLSSEADTVNLTTLASWAVTIDQPATVDLLAGMLKNTNDPLIQRMAVSGLISRRSDARVRPLLEDIAAHEADPQLREAAGNALRPATPPPGT